MGKLFRNDYSELAHINVIKALEKAASEQNIGYGLDTHSFNAQEKIKEVFGCKDGSVHFLVGGTQANMTVISYCLRDYEAVLACESGHINVHETGSVENSGHKIYTVKPIDGKMTIEGIKSALKFNCNEHTVKIKMIYISNATESGTIYQKQELKDIYQFCLENDLYLFIDGARLGTALTSKENDIDVKELASLCDVFYVGGTKNGLMIGEAVVFTNNRIQGSFRNQIKTKGAMLAKGFFAGIEFETIFEDNLYFNIARHANEMGEMLLYGLKELGFDVQPSPTNQIFVTLEKDQAEKLMNEFGCELWEEVGDKLKIRFVTSFNTQVEDVQNVFEYCKKYL